MPQNPDSANIATYNGARVPLAATSAGKLQVETSGTSTVSGTVAVSAVAGNVTVVPPTLTPALNITASTALKASAGTIAVVNVAVAGSAAGAVHDCATVGAASAANKIADLTDANTGTYTLNWPCATGITIIVGTGQTITATYR